MLFVAFAGQRRNSPDVDSHAMDNGTGVREGCCLKAGGPTQATASNAFNLFLRLAVSFLFTHSFLTLRAATAFAYEAGYFRALIGSR